MAAVVIAAHNEGRAIGLALSRLAPLASPGDLELIVVAHGCTDDTAKVASSFGPAVRVISIGHASKQQALRAGDEAASGFPRVYLDADVEFGAQDLISLIAEARKPGVLAAAPRLVLRTDGCPWPVRWYYEVYLRLPEVRRGLVGRGMIAVSEAGHRRLAAYVPPLGYDLAAYLAFAPAERRVVTAASVHRRPPRTVAALLAGRIGAAAALARFEHERHLRPSRAWTRPADLAGIVRSEPSLAPKVAWFMLTVVLAKLCARAAVARDIWRARSARQAG